MPYGGYRDTSRYVGGTLFKVPETTNKYQLDARKFLKLEDFQNWAVIFWEANDRIDNIAFDYYGDAGLWWVIADVNNIQFPLELQEGDKVYIPDRDEVIEIVRKRTEG